MTHTTYMSNKTQRAQSIIRAYNKSDMRSLRNAYEKWSDAKEEAWSYCMNLMREFEGGDLKIISYGIQYFSAGFEFLDSKGKKHLCYITHANNYVIPME